MFFILYSKNHIYYFLKPKMKYEGSYKYVIFFFSIFIIAKELDTHIFILYSSEFDFLIYSFKFYF